MLKKFVGIMLLFAAVFLVISVIGAPLALVLGLIAVWLIL